MLGKSLNDSLVELWLKSLVGGKVFSITCVPHGVMASSEELDSGVHHDQVVWNSVLSPLVILDKFVNIVVATMQVDMNVARLLQASVWVEDVAILS